MKKLHLDNDFRMNKPLSINDKHVKSTKIVTHIMKPLTAHAHCMSSFQRLGVFEHRVFVQQGVTASLSQTIQVLFAC